MSYYEEIEFNEKLEVSEGDEFIDCSFDSINFAELSLNNTKLVDCTFINCNLSNVSVLNSTFRGTKFVDCKIVGVNFSNCLTLHLLSFKSCILNYSVFQNIEGVNFEFHSCGLKEVDFSESKLNETSFLDSELDLANFSGTDLRKADFRGAFGYQIDPLSSKIKGAKFQAPEVLGLLTSFGIDIS
ncbi:pentapeptide repeat-containing protein [Bacteriovorax sp. Seq25_V]|uniref:pentapeptide repeat-containing protein n=1 Tax=Bacteriovorax sp. Seq25_V TaxID=1201288 RepID=UPI00038A39D3|nr:pentapeptide repeat-containing protein [Bacteriovorax sp. Seq25_V]EQC44720.1 pentapeptide repeat protein [Bacteriovorax sp. Seq25_V]